MANDYIGRVQIDGGAVLPVGSTLFGICNTPIDTAAKIIQESDQTLGAYFKTLSSAGVTVHIKFTYGNSIAANDSNNLLTLKVGSSTAKQIINPGGSCIWSPGAVVSFTYDGTYWVANDGTLTSIPIKNTYDPADTDAISGVGVAAALGTLDVNSITGFGAGKTLASLSETDGKIAATFQDISITTAQVSNFPTLGDAAGKSVVDSITSTNKTSTDLPTVNAVTNYIDNRTASLTGAMHFKGELNSLPDATDTTTFETYEAGDVVLVGDQEYVYDKRATAAESSWVLLGDEGSYALKSRTASVGSAGGWSQGAKAELSYTPKTVTSVKTITAGSAATLTTTSFTVPNVTTAGAAASFQVESGVLKIGTGSAPVLGTAFSIAGVNSFTANVPTTLTLEGIDCDDITNWSDGTLPSLSITGTTVVIP